MPDLSKHLGAWSGTWSTWLQPGELYDESPITLDVEPADGGWSIDYRGSIGGDPVTGRMVVTADGRHIDWTDSWHTAGSQERLDADGDSAPSYDYGPSDGPWTWSIHIEAADDLLITHTNRPPGADPALAVEMRCSRSD